MADDKFPPLDPANIVPTRDALHAYSAVIGSWAASCRRRRKHWWHASLRPSVFGLRTGPIYGATAFELEVDLANSQLRLTSCLTSLTERLCGQSSAELSDIIKRTLRPLGIDERFGPADDDVSAEEYPGYSSEVANRLHRAFGSVSAALEDFRAGTREEKSPIQVWPHHFDLAMIWLPGHKIPGEPIEDEEQSDKQMNFGFVLGDSMIAEPYFYVTAYPTPDAMADTPLPAGATWRTDGFTGAVALYRDVVTKDDPHAYLLDLWNTLVDVGRQHLAVDDT